MKRFVWLAFTAWISAAQAQQNAPHLAYALPAGGRQGATIQVTLGGQFLPNVTKVYVSGVGVRAAVAGYAKPMNAAQATQLRDRMAELQKLPMDAAARQEMLDTRVKLLTFNAGRLTSPVLAETVTLQVAIAAGAQPGKRELRVSTPQGLSNPLAFCVGQPPEFTETETIDVIPPGPNQPVNQAQISRPVTDMRITLPATVNGRIKPGLPHTQARAGQPFTPGEADRYRFQARQGQQLVIAVSARELMPYLADAVPGWFQAVLTLTDSTGNEVAYCDDFRFHPDPVIHYSVPREGEYTVEIKDALYRGREDFVYRMAIGELPFVTGIFPLGGSVGKKTTVELTGWNLPTNKLTVDARSKTPDTYPVSVSRPGLSSNVEPFLADSLPQAFEKEPNDSAASAQKVKLPVAINGRVGQPGDWDVFRFEGRAGQEIAAEVYARRLDSPLDSVLRLTDAKGKQLAFNDDYDDQGAGLETHHADSKIMTALPAAGTYYLWLGDAQHKGGPEYAYRLRISAPRPDFALRATPSAINAGANMTVPITVHALRLDGFSGEIALALKDAPRGFALAGGVIPAGQDQARLTLTAPAQALDEPVSLSLEGRATIEGHSVARLAVAAEDMMQAFAYRHLVPAGELKAQVRKAVALRGPIRVTGAAPLQIPSGGDVRFQVQVPIPLNSAIDKVMYELSEPPEGVELRGTSPTIDGEGILLHCDAAKAKPGLKGNLIVAVSAERRPAAGAAAAPANRQRVQIGTLPAIPFEIVKR